MIAIIDYQAGNLTSVIAALHHLNLEAEITNDPQKILSSDRVLFPGVGAAGKAMFHLQESNLIPTLKTFVQTGRPFLGICLGYQILFDYSEENETTCLGLLKGKVKHFSDPLFDKQNRRLKVPHMGWNNVSFAQPDHHLWQNINNDSDFYFVHSYFVKPQEKEQASVICDYGHTFAAGTICRNIAGVQFHPEKSGEKGLILLQNFATWNP